MPSWNELTEQLEARQNVADLNAWFNQTYNTALGEIGRLRGGRHVLVYGSAFLQKPQAPPYLLQLTAEELNGLMAVIYGMEWGRGLTLLLHTPGGVINAAESFVAYLRSKFTDIEVIVPAFAMSAGTMIALASNRVVMGRQSQLGPIDPQMPVGGRSVSARAIVDQFALAKEQILENLDTAHLWAPVLQSVGPSLLVEAQNALDYGERMVARWLASYMFEGLDDPMTKGLAVAKHFNDANTHKSHGRRIDRAEAQAQGVVVEELEADQALQEHVLTAYHLMTLSFEKSLAAKVMRSDTDRSWLKNWASPEDPPSPGTARAPQGTKPEPARPGATQGKRQGQRQQPRRQR